MSDPIDPAVLRRVSDLVDGLGTQKEAAQKTGIAYATLQRILAGRSSLTLQRLEKIAAAAGVSVREIVGGEPNGQVVDLPVARRVAIFDQHASAGNGSHAFDVATAIGSLEFPGAFLREYGDAQRLKILKVAGDSMQPTLDDGALLMFREGDMGPADGIFVIRHNDLLKAKRLTFLGHGKVRVSSDNADYARSDIILDLQGDECDQRSDFAIIGRAVWTGKTLG